MGEVIQFPPRDSETLCVHCDDPIEHNGEQWVLPAYGIVLYEGGMLRDYLYPENPYCFHSSRGGHSPLAPDGAEG